MSHRMGLERLLLPMISKATRAQVRPTSATRISATPATPQRATTAQVYGESFFAAQDLGTSVRRLTQLMGQPPLTNTFGARDQWAAIATAAKPSTKKPASARDET